jgi:hypothetical protein
MNSVERLERSLLAFAAAFFASSVLLILVGALLFASPGTVAPAGWEQTFGVAGQVLEKFGEAILIASILIFTTERLLKRELLAFIGKHFRDSMERFGDVFDLMVLPARFRSAFVESDETNGLLFEFGDSIHRVYVKGLRFHEQKIVLEDRDWAMESARRFYEMLRDYCAKRPSEYDTRKVEVCVTHPGRVSMWTRRDHDENDEAHQAIISQERFLRSNRSHHTIKRIFVGDGEKPDDELLAVMREMEGVGITTFYLRKDPHDVPDFTWVPGLVVMLWEREGSQRVAKIKIEPDRGHHIKAQWDDLLEAATPYQDFAKKRRFFGRSSVAV